MTSTSETTAFFRVEGTLVRRTAAGCAAWLAAGQRDWGSRPARLSLVGAAGMLAALGADRAGLAWRALRDGSEDRLVVLARHYEEDCVRTAWNEAGWDLLARCREAGDRLVLLSDHPDVCLAAVRERAAGATLVCNQLEVRDGRVTGALVEPVLTGRFDGGWLRRWVERDGGDPRRIRAYGSSFDDATLLAGASQPCAVTPDRALRRLAREHAWPVVDA